MSKPCFASSQQSCIGSLLLAATLFSTPALGDELRPQEDLPIAVFEVNEGERNYTRLSAGDQAHYLFCGRGDLRILSRAVLSGRAGSARYTIQVGVDGAKPQQEFSYRAEAFAEARFDVHSRATSLRSTTLELHRGCHTIDLTLAQSTTNAVAVRLLFKEQPAIKRRWGLANPHGAPRPESLVVGKSRTDYHLLSSGQALDFPVEGPAWIRVLARPLGPSDEVSYTLRAENKGKPLRTYLLKGSHSKKAKLAGRPELNIGEANEVVFPIGPGTQRLELRASPGLDLLLRTQIAERGETRPPDGVEPAWLVNARLSSYYDDNILRYSDKFIQRFDEGRDPRRFRVESLDDVVQRLDLYLDRRFPGIGGKEAKVGFDVERRAYLRNSIKDWTRVAASWEQDFRLDRQLRFTVSWAPGFYVRHIRDSDLTGRNQVADPFQAFEFDKGEARTQFSQKWGTSINARYHLGLANFRHSDAFREFDSENLFAGIRLDQRVNRRFRLSYALEFTDSDARGYDEDGETLATSDDTDPSYRQLDLMLAARYRFPGKWRSTLFLQAEAGQREYTTDKPTSSAPLHAGREDDILRLYASWQLRLTPKYSLTLFAQSRDRSSTAPIELDIGVEKNFEQYEVGARITARFGNS